MPSRMLRTFAVAVALATSAACAGYIYPRSGVVYVRRAPPATRIELVTTSPGHGYVWVRGYWAWRTGNFLWVPGIWIVIPPGQQQWVAGQWDHDRYGWYWRDGRWR